MRERLSDPDDVLHCPHLLAVEVGQVLRRLVSAGLLAAERVAEALTDLSDLPAIRHDHELLLGRIWELKENLTAYDATYVVLAELIDAPPC